MYQVDKKILDKYGISVSSILAEDESKSRVMRSYVLQDDGKHLVQFIVRTRKCDEMNNYAECTIGSTTYYVFLQITERNGKNFVMVNGKKIPLIQATT